MCDWALRRPGAAHEIAQIELDGFASQRVLQRRGFAERRGGGYNLFPARFLSDFFGPQGAANSRALGAVLVPSQVDDILWYNTRKRALQRAAMADKAGVYRSGQSRKASSVRQKERIRKIQAARRAVERRAAGACRAIYRRRGAFSACIKRLVRPRKTRLWD